MCSAEVKYEISQACVKLKTHPPDNVHQNAGIHFYHFRQVEKRITYLSLGEISPGDSVIFFCR